jgi:hypothetical protein
MVLKLKIPPPKSTISLRKSRIFGHTTYFIGEIPLLLKEGKRKYYR